MKRSTLICAGLLILPIAGFATADGSWLKKVSDADRARTNPYTGNAAAAQAGQNLFRNNCAKCHGENGEGKGKRPALKSERIHNATDGELAWILKNGESFKGMPGWGALPEPERWQIVTYLRSLNGLASGVQQ
jgi:mono/diheme cytochrome c family protein